MINPHKVLSLVSAHSENLKTNFTTLDYLEGNLEPAVKKSLARQLSARVYAYAVERMVPINILPRYVEKLSNIYQTGVSREVIGGGQSDTDLLSWYEEKLAINRQMHLANRLFNACGSTLVHPYVTEVGPALRIIANDRFVVYSDDPINPLNPTGVILLAGVDEAGRTIYWVYEDNSFAVVRSDESIDFAAMAAMGVPNGENPYGRLPFVYGNSSALKLVPIPDRDTLRMTEFIPVALTDLNVAAMFSSFSVNYILNGSVENLTYAPNALWFLKQDDPEKDVTIGTIKPEVDYQEVLNLIQSQLSMWLASKGIKSGGVGQLTAESATSGIAKMIDESDTYDVRQEQTVHFGSLETEMWDLILNYMHPVWVSQGRVENRTSFFPGAKVATRFSVTPVGTQRSQLITDQKEEYGAGFTTRSRAIMALNPNMTMTQVEELMREIDAERGISDEQVRESEDSSTGANRGQEESEETSGSYNREDSGED